MIKYISKATIKKLEGQTALVRVDLNTDPQKGEFRLNSILPTIDFLINRGIKVLLLSHRGRHNQNPPSLKKYSAELQRKLDLPVVFVESFNFPKVRKELKANDYKVYLMENLRFKPEEEKNNIKFAEKLAKLGDFYVNDAFAVSHRKNASVEAITKLMPSFGGLLLEKEIKNLKKIIKNPSKPLTIIIGGVKAATKLKVLRRFFKKTDNFLLGGGVANTFMIARGSDIGNSAYDKDSIKAVSEFLECDKILIPKDFIKKNNTILDIGEETVKEYKKIIKSSGTVIWNGPLGYFEKKEYSKGTLRIAQSIANSNAFSVVGGGETTDFISEHGMDNKFDFVSTGGGAMLEFLAGEKLPGIEALKKSNIKNQNENPKCKESYFE